VHGSRDRRADRLAVQQNMNPKEAQDLVKNYDGQRTSFFRHAYDLDWLDSTNYDIAINTDEIDEDTAVSWILTGVQGVADTLQPAQ
jgi:cytidylate kinase